jgi:RimJ/RimL family protein N-acetyltransferase
VVELSTDRLAIRQFELTDDEFILRLLNEKSFLHFIGDKGVRTLEDARDYLSNGPMASYAAHGFGLFLVAEKASGNSIGMCGLLRRDDQEHPDIGFAFLSEYRSLGYAYESAAAVMEFGHVELKIDTIVALVKPENSRSIRLLERLGLCFAGETNFEGSSSTTSLYSSSKSA